MVQRFERCAGEGASRRSDHEAVARAFRGLKGVGDGVGELRIDYGPGYRLNFLGRGETVVILPCGGDKRSQDRDIARAKQIAREFT